MLLFLKVRTISEGVVEREMGINCVLEALNLTKLSVPHWDILTKSALIEFERVFLHRIRTLVEGCEGKSEDEWKVESSANA